METSRRQLLLASSMALGGALVSGQSVFAQTNATSK